MTQANGIAGLHRNTIMFGWTRHRDHLESQLRILSAVSHAGKNAIIARINWAHEPGREKRIDIWWGGLQNNGDLMLLLAYLLRLNSEWQNARICVRSVARDEEERQQQLERLKHLLPETRIGAESEVIVMPPGHRFIDVLHETSRDSDVVFLGLNTPPRGTESEYADRIAEFAGQLV